MSNARSSDIVIMGVYESHFLCKLIFEVMTIKLAIMRHLIKGPAKRRFLTEMVNPTASYIYSDTERVMVGVLHKCICASSVT